MKIGTVKLSSVKIYKRLDAEFYLGDEEIDQRIERTKKQLAQAAERLKIARDEKLAEGRRLDVFRRERIV